MEEKLKRLSRFLIKLQGKDYVLFEGLLDLAHQEGLQSVHTNLIQLPSKENDMTAVVHAEVKTEKGEFSGIGDASPSSVSRTLVPHIIRLAETRALARALRFAVNIGMTTVEELDSLNFDEIPAGITSPGLGALEYSPGEVVLNFGKYVNKSINEIYEENSGYIEWLRENAQNDYVRKAAREFLKERKEPIVKQ